MTVSAADQLAQAERILASLEARLAAAKDRARELARRRREVAYGAESGTVPFAAQTLEELREETVRNQLTIEDLPHAITGARQAIQAAEQAVAEEQQKARATLPTVGKLRAAATAAEDALQGLIGKIRAIDDIATELLRSELGLGRVELYRVAIRRGVATGLAGAGLAPALALHERAVLGETVARLCDQAEQRLRRLMGELPDPATEIIDDGDELEPDDVDDNSLLGLTEDDFAEVAALASNLFNKAITAGRCRDIYDAWAGSVEEPAEPTSRWIFKRLKNNARRQRAA